MIAATHFLPGRNLERSNAYSKSPEFFIGSFQWFDALPPPLEAYIQRFAGQLLRIPGSVQKSRKKWIRG
jgi:hypothetical protein